MLGSAPLHSMVRSAQPNLVVIAFATSFASRDSTLNVSLAPRLAAIFNRFSSRSEQQPQLFHSSDVSTFQLYITTTSRIKDHYQNILTISIRLSLMWYIFSKNLLFSNIYLIFCLPYCPILTQDKLFIANGNIYFFYQKKNLEHGHLIVLLIFESSHRYHK